MRMKTLALAALICAAPLASAQDQPAVFRLTVTAHRFQPAELLVPAGVKFRLIVKNEDVTPEEIESHDLNREKVIPAGGEAVLFIGPLKAGVYDFFGEFHPTTAKGRIIAK
jgi:hypothetical protein